MTGILLLVAAFQIVPLMDAIAKYLSADYSVWQLVWARFFFHFLLLAPLLLGRYGLGTLLTLPRQGLQMLRGFLLLISTILFFAALRTIPLADAIALIFVEPLIITALSPWLLGESVGWRRRLAVVVGFFGALIVIRPGMQTVDWGSIWALLCGCTFALYIIATRKLAGSAPPLVTLGYTAFFGMVVLSAVMLLGGSAVWRTPDLTTLGLMAAMGLIAAVGHFLIIKAFEYAPASLLAPFSYSEIIMATILGYAVFGNFPDPWTWFGIAVIIASGVYISLRERRAGG